MYYITRDGFTFIVMGFTGKTAAKFKEDYINAFNEMEKTIKRIALDDYVTRKHYDTLVKETQRLRQQADYWQRIAESHLRSLEQLTKTLKQHNSELKPPQFYYLTEEYYNILVNSFKDWLLCENLGFCAKIDRDEALLKRFNAARTLFYDSTKRLHSDVAAKILSGEISINL